MSEQAAFVVGATGYTGRGVVAALRRRGVTTVAHVRPGSSRLGEWRGRFEALGASVSAAPWTEEGMAEAVAEAAPTLLFACLGTTRARVKAEQKAGGAGMRYDAVDYGLTAMAVDAADRWSAAGPGRGPVRVVYVSAYGVRLDKPPREGSYMHARWKVEKRLADGSLPWIAARPGFISGADRDETRVGERVGAIALGGVFRGLAALGMRGAQETFGTMTGDELAEAMVHAALDAGTPAAHVLVGRELREAARAGASVAVGAGA